MSPSCSLSVCPLVWKICHLPLRQNMVSCLSCCVLIFAGKCVKRVLQRTVFTQPSVLAGATAPPHNSVPHRFIDTIRTPRPSFSFTHVYTGWQPASSCALGKCYPIPCSCRSTGLTLLQDKGQRGGEIAGQRETHSVLVDPLLFCPPSLSFHPPLQCQSSLIVLNVAVSSSAVAGF